MSSLSYEIKSFIASAAQQIGNTWEDPAKLGPAVSGQMTAAKIRIAEQKLATIGRSIDLAIHREAKGQIGDALATWRNEVFGPMFPLS